jgi:hypothetical protein
VLQRLETFLENLIDAQVREVIDAWDDSRDPSEFGELFRRAQLPRDGPASRQYLRCSQKWFAISLRCLEALPLVLLYDAWNAAAEPATTAAADAPLPESADLAVAQPGDCRTRDVWCEEGPSDADTAPQAVVAVVFPSGHHGCDEPSFQDPDDTRKPPAAAPSIRQRPHNPRSPPSRTVSRAA